MAKSLSLHKPDENWQAQQHGGWPSLVWSGVPCTLSVMDTMSRRHMLV